MKGLLLAVAFALLISSCAQTGDQEKQQAPAEHQPFITWVKAIKASDLEAFKSAYSENMRKSFAGKGWQKSLDEYKRSFEKELGDFKVEDFAIAFEADGKEQGRLLVRFKEKDLPPLNVVKEDGAWKIDEY